MLYLNLIINVVCIPPTTAPSSLLFAFPAGGGRTGWAQAAWLVVDGGMSPEQAAEAVTSYAAVQGLSRRVDVAKLKEFVAACQL